MGEPRVRSGGDGPDRGGGLCRAEQRFEGDQLTVRRPRWCAVTVGGIVGQSGRDWRRHGRCRRRGYGLRAASTGVQPIDIVPPMTASPKANGAAPASRRDHVMTS